MYILYISLVLLICYAAIHLAVFYKKEERSMMDHMMTTMQISMCFGLSLGLFFGILYPETLYLATLFAILFGGFAGLLYGIRFSYLTVLEGFFSGMMAAMMGAMLGVMIPLDKANLLLWIFIALTIVSCLMIVRQYLDHLFDRFHVLFIVSSCVLLFALFFTFPNPPEKAPAPHADHTSEICK